MVLLGCGELRPPGAPRPSLVTYHDVRPILDARCATAGCHRGAGPSGGYDLSSYIGVLGVGSDDVRNAIASDASSLLLTKLDAVKEPRHWGYLLPQSSDLRAGETAESRRDADLVLLRRWVVDYGLAYFDVLVHPPSWLYAASRASDDFHGGFLRARQWDLDACRGCHGNDLRGGTSGRDCSTCHDGGPEGCTTCHGSSARSGPTAVAPPTDLSWSTSRSARGVGAHQAHLRDRAWWAKIECVDCHRVPTALRDPGHASSTDGRATLTFGARAALSNVAPLYSPSTTTCSVYCHGASFAAIKQGEVPTWTDTQYPGCNTCHKVPAVAGGPDCSVCHPQSVKPCTPGTDPACLQTAVGVGVAFLSPSLHGDGTYPLGKPGVEGTCYACHGTKDSAGAPAPDLHGATAVSAVGVGLHAAHLTDSALRKAVPCDSCHIVPAALMDKGHIDHDLPAIITFSDLARGATRGATVDTKPTWDRTTATCTNVYCHSLNGGTGSPWRWTQTSTPGCTSCHGQPPGKTVSGGNHPQGVTSCKQCHGSAYTASGDLDPTKHMNGKVDL
jgi:predicted CxxxxCH...CXXCH cytochrome family protein